MKTCTKCNKTKPLSNFGKDNRIKSGYASICKQCRREKRQRQKEENPEKFTAASKKYYDVHKEELLEGSRQYRLEHLEEMRRRGRERYWEDRERCLERAKCYREKMRGTSIYLKRGRENKRRYRKAHPERAREKSKRNKATRRRVLAGAEGSHTEVEWQNILKHYEYKCIRCGATDDLARDHIVPLSRGGSDYANNLQPLCRSCNAYKGVRYIDYRPESYWED